MRSVQKRCRLQADTRLPIGLSPAEPTHALLASVTCWHYALSHPAVIGAVVVIAVEEKRGKGSVVLVLHDEVKTRSLGLLSKGPVENCALRETTVKVRHC